MSIVCYTHVHTCFITKNISNLKSWVEPFLVIKHVCLGTRVISFVSKKNK